jgi:ribosomal protein S27AE
MDPAPPRTRTIHCDRCGHATVHVKHDDGNWYCDKCHGMMA